MPNPVRWTIYIDAFRPATPVYDSSLAVVSAQEGGEMFFRNRLTGDITFVRSDFDYLLAECGMEDRVEVIFEEFTGTWDLLFHGYFYRSDSEIDEDNRTWTVTPKPLDRYDNVMNALDREFDLVRLETPRTPVEFTQQGIIQVYLLGATFLNNYIGSTHWEQETVLTPNQFELETVHHFEAFSPIFIAGDDVVLDPDVSGTYLKPDPFGTDADRLDGAYRIRLNPVVSPSVQWEIVTLPGLVPVYQKAIGEPLSTPIAFKPTGFTFHSLTTASECEAFQENVWARVLTNETTVGLDPTFALPASDIVDDNFNYTRAFPFEAISFIGSSMHRTDAGRWGKYAADSLHFAGEYFVRPEVALGTLFPVNRSQWEQYSLWIYISPALRDLLTDAGTDRVIRDAYRVSDVLSTLLAEIDPLVFHQDNVAYSDFFYGTANPIRTIRNRLALTPKSNVLKGDYDQPASRAPIKLGEVLTLLKNAYRVYWHIDGTGKLVLEHIHYYERGGSYTTNQIGADLTTIKEPKTGKVWGWRSKRYKYEKEAMPEGFRFAWMDQVSFPFSGYSLDMRSAFIQRGQFEDVNMGPFTSDLAFGLAQPSALSPDGFYFFDGGQGSDEITVTSIEITISTEEDYFLQNGTASVVYLHDKYHRHGLPAPLIRLNGNDVTASTVRRAKLQEEDFPAPDGLDPMELITTAIGTGQVRELSLNVSSRAAKITIAHDTQ